MPSRPNRTLTLLKGCFLTAALFAFVKDADAYPVTDLNPQRFDSGFYSVFSVALAERQLVLVQCKIYSSLDTRSLQAIPAELCNYQNPVYLSDFLQNAGLPGQPGLMAALRPPQSLREAVLARPQCGPRDSRLLPRPHAGQLHPEGT